MIHTVFIVPGPVGVKWVCGNCHLSCTYRRHRTIPEAVTCASTHYDGTTQYRSLSLILLQPEGTLI